DAIDAARAIREKVLSPLDLVESLLERIDRIDGRVQAWALLDREGARLAARQAADEAARGVFRGPLHGVPFGAKDIFYSAGLRTEAGSKVMAGFVLRARGPQADVRSDQHARGDGAQLHAGSCRVDGSERRGRGARALDHRRPRSRGSELVARAGARLSRRADPTARAACRRLA